MPELPEVETIRRQLAHVLPGRVFRSVEVRLPKQVRGMKADKFKKAVVGSRVVSLARRAKMLVIKTNRYWLVFHLKMSGQVIFRDKLGHLKGGGHPIKGALEQLPNKYSHVIFGFRDGAKLFFNDLRQFGWVTVVKSLDEVEALSAVPLGPEPLTAKFELAEFIRCMKARANLNVYQALMDQKCVVGVGNIYANEALFAAGIKPTRRNKNVTQAEYKKLFTEIIRILKLAVKQRGTTIDKYMDALGNFGSFTKYLKVYGREGKSCTRKCGGTVKRIKIGGRSAFHCPKCQK